MVKKIYFFILVLLISANSVFADVKISVLIDDTVITNYDIKKESDYLELLSPSFSKLDDSQKLGIAKNSLINQIIKKKEIKKFPNLETEKELLDNYLISLYSSLNLTKEEDFKILLKKKEINLAEIKEKIEIELSWNKLIYLRYNNQVIINEKEILNKVAKIQEGLRKKYLLSEIVFKKNKEKTVDEIYNEIKLSIKDIGFSNTATIYSSSDSSKYGGKLGWVNALSLPENIEKKLNLLNKGELTNLIKFGNNFSILKIEDIKIEKAIINRDEEIDKLKNIEMEKQLKRFSKIFFNKTKLNYFINEI